MTDPHHGPWTCPDCRGGFPEPENGACPWCGVPVDGEYEYEPRVISHIKADEDDKPEFEPGGGPIYRRLFGWLQ